MSVARKDPRDKTKMKAFVALDAQIKDVITAVCKDLDETGCVPPPRAVENESRDGFFPYTEGGWDGIVYCDLWSDIGSGTVPTLLQATADRQQAECGEEWDRENPETPYATIFERTTEDEGQQRLPGFKTSAEYIAAQVKREAYYEFENDYMQEGLNYFLKARALYYDTDNRRNETGKPEVMFCVGLNDDFEYGRDDVGWLASPANGGPGTHWLWEKTVPVEELTEELLETIQSEMISALKNA